MTILRHYWLESVALTLPFVTALALATGPAEARPISGSDLSRTLEMCLASPNGQPFSIGNVWGCCNPAGGWCVVCVGSPSADKVCEFSYVRGGLPPKNHVDLNDLGIANSVIKGTKTGDGKKLIDELLDLAK